MVYDQIRQVLVNQHAELHATEASQRIRVVGIAFLLMANVPHFAFYETVNSDVTVRDPDLSPLVWGLILSSVCLRNTESGNSEPSREQCHRKIARHLNADAHVNSRGDRRCESHTFQSDPLDLGRKDG